MLALGGFAVAMVALATMTQAGFSGNTRYVLPGVAAMAVLAGVGAGMAGELPVRGRRPRSPRLAGWHGPPARWPPDPRCAPT